MSKFALEAYATALRQELAAVEPRPHVCTINPGPILTPLTTTDTQQEALKHVRAESRWTQQLHRLVKRSQQYVRYNGVEPQLAAKALADVVHARRPPERTTINYTLEMRLAALTPQMVMDAVVGFMAQ